MSAVAARTVLPSGYLCRGCGRMVAQVQLRVRAITPEGAISFTHSTDTRRLCDGEVLVLAVGDPTITKAPPRPEPLPSERCDYGRRVEDYKMALLRWAMQRSGNSITGAAERLGLKRTTLQQMILRRGHRQVSYDFRPLKRTSEAQEFA
jgi:transcriptional regulator with GAF, ATPase, and Fis domain